MFTSLLPGLRDLRAPLSAGYLWLAAGWLWLVPQLPASVNDAEGVLKDIYRVIHASEPIVVIAGLSFVAYMLGILSNGLLIPPLRFIVKLPLYVLAIPAVISAVIGVMASERSPIIGSKFDNFFAVSRAVRLRFKVFDTASIRADRLALRRMSNKILMDEDYRGTFLSRLKEELEGILAYPGALGSDGLRQLLFVRDLIADPSIDNKEKETEILERLSKYLDEGYSEAAQALVMSVVDLDHHSRDVLDELTLVPEWLVGDRSGTYERWDRLRAESEFRQAVVPPLLAILGALLVRGVLVWPFVLIFMVPPILIFIQGISKEKEANGQLLQTLEADVISTPAIDRLMTKDLYWFRSRRHWGFFVPGEQYRPDGPA